MLAQSSVFVTWAPSPEATLRLGTFLGFVLLCAGLALPAVQPGAAGLDEVGASRWRGPAAILRARLDAAQDHVEPREKLDALDHALADLAELAPSANIDLAAPLDPEALQSLVLEAATMRAEAASSLAAFPGGARGEFLRSIAPGAVVGDWQFGVPASITMAQAILESGWGRSAPGYNLFGMKGEGTAGSERRRVVEYSRGRRQVRSAPFRSYHSFAESMADHARVVGTSPRYAIARAAGEDPRAFAEALEGRYATDPRYAEKLAALSDSYGLEALNWRGRPPLAEPTGLPFLAE